LYEHQWASLKSSLLWDGSTELLGFDNAVIARLLKSVCPSPVATSVSFLHLSSFLLLDTPRLNHHHHHHVWSFGQSRDSPHGQIRAAHRTVSRQPRICSHVACPHSQCHEWTANTLPSFINNEWVKGVDGKTFEVINPTDESVICSVHEATEKDVDLAVSAARKAFEGEWRKVTPDQRGRLLVKLADLFEQNTDLLAAAESLDNGKAITMAKGDVGACAGCLRYYGGWADKIEGKIIDTNPDSFNYTKKEPVSSSFEN
jgi:hypothetical protein